MANIDELYAGQFLSAETLKSSKLVGKTAKISNVEAQMVGQGERARTKLVLSLDGIEKQLVVNKTNALTIADAYGKDYDQWVGKSITLLLTKRLFQGTNVDAIAVSIPSSTAKIEKVLQCVECNTTYQMGQIFCSACGEKL